VLLDAEDRLFDTSPPLPSAQDRLLDRQVRGAWAPLDLFGPTRRRFFLEALDEGFTEDDAARLSRPRGSLRARPSAPVPPLGLKNGPSL